MDMDAYKGSLRKALARLPKEILETVPALVVKHMPVLEKIFPAIMEDMIPHIGAANIERMTGSFDEKGMMAATEEVLKEFGIEPPKAAA
jgi:hypothetical protein